MRLFATAALVVVALAASKCSAQSAEQAPIRFSRGSDQHMRSLRERKLSKDKKNKKHHQHQEEIESETEGTPIPEEEYYAKETRQQQPSCSVCGDGKKVGNTDGLVSFPGQAGQIPCGVLENMGTVGLIPPPQCDVLPQLISTVCECKPINPPTTTGATDPATTSTKATKPGYSKTNKSAPMSHSLSVPSKAGKSKTAKTKTTKATGKTKSYKSSFSLSTSTSSSSSKGSKMMASKASAKSSSRKSSSKSSKSSGSTVDAKAEKITSAKASAPKASKSSRA